MLTTAAGSSAPTFFGHPRGLVICFATELWERFSYYGMRALLIFYLTQHFLFTDQQAFLIYGAYTAMVYVMPVVGGMLADRYLGARKAVCFGAILLVVGHFGMAIEGPAAVEGVERDDFYLQIFYLSLAFIITGVGFLKANISTIVGALYEEGDVRRDSGFTIFYMGINIGAFASSLLCGWLGQTYGWSYGFGLAGIGMLFGLVVFLRGQKLLEGHAEPPNIEQLKQPIFVGLSREICIYIGAIVGVLAVWQLVQNQQLVGNLLMGSGGIMLAVILGYAFFKCTPQERDRMLTASALIVFSVIFWALFEQAGSSLNLFADRIVDRSLMGWEIPASMFQSLNAFFIFLLAPIFSVLWIRLAKRGIEPSTPVKFSLAIFQVGLGFLVLVFGITTFGDGGKPGMIWLVLIYLLHTTGELCLSPVGLSMITKLSVKRVVGMMMGVWFLASAGANYIASLIASLTSTKTVGGVVQDQVSATANVLDVYTNVGWLAVGVSVLLLLISPLLRKGMHGVH
ncbi:MAG: POT family proton-dependent oligopeptide transporter [Gammaproteobacteria bacterium]|jgi:POT family proton-dependent oligopeptide transporter